jgi:TIGR03009 family protein
MMRGLILGLALMVTGSSVLAQVPGEAAPAVDPKVVTHLQAWQQVMAATTNFYSVCTLQRKHLIVKNKASTHVGSVMCLKGPNGTTMAKLHIDRIGPDGQPVPGEFMRYVCTGRAVYQYDGSVKEVTEYLLQGNGVGNNLLLEFISGALTAEAILRRFDVALSKQDANWVYLEIRPRNPADRQEFQLLKLALFAPGTAKAYLPRMVVMDNPNGQESETWSFEDPKAPGQDPRVNAAGIEPRMFEPEKPPAGWKVIQDPRRNAPQPGGGNPPPGAPRVARPVGP